MHYGLLVLGDSTSPLSSLSFCSSARAFSQVKLNYIKWRSSLFDRCVRGTLSVCLPACPDATRRCSPLGCLCVGLALVVFPLFSFNNFIDFSLCSVQIALRAIFQWLDVLPLTAVLIEVIYWQSPHCKSPIIPGSFPRLSVSIFICRSLSACLFCLTRLSL